MLSDCGKKWAEGDYRSPIPVSSRTNVRDLSGRISRCVRLCENTVHGSTWLTTNGALSQEIEHLPVRPEPSSKGSEPVFTQSGARNDRRTKCWWDRVKL